MISAKPNKPVRDLMLAVLLILLVKPALHLSAKRIQNERETGDSFPIHELDQNIVLAFQMAKEQIDQAIVLATNKQKLEAVELLEDLSSTLTTIEKRYGQNSPALLFLGPFASVSIVLKEREIEKELNSIVDQVQNALYELIDQRKQLIPQLITLGDRLKKNKQLIARSRVS